jgi:hypothetical protein
MAADAGKEFFRKLIRRKKKMEERPEQFGLFALTSESEDNLDPGLLDIVAVHGINGDTFNTWIYGDYGALWFRDFLPSQISGARVFIFGYDSNIAFTRVKGSLDSYAKELLEQLNAVRFGKIQISQKSLRYLINSTIAIKV